MYSVQLSKKALKFLDSLEPDYRALVISKIKLLKQDLFPRGSKKLDGWEKCYRLRVGDIRVQYHVKAEDKSVLVYKITRREKAYK